MDNLIAESKQRIIDFLQSEEERLEAAPRDPDLEEYHQFFIIYEALFKRATK